MRETRLTCCDFTIFLFCFQVGVDALGMQITVVFPNGCFAMAKMIVGMDRMSSMKIAHRVKRKEISVVETEDVFQSK